VRERAEQKITEADLYSRHERRLRAAAEGWLILANVMQRAEASLQDRRTRGVGPRQRGAFCFANAYFRRLM
jgi:hypothetical protein